MVQAPIDYDGKPSFVDGFIVTKYFLKSVRVCGFVCKLLQILQLTCPKIRQFITLTALLLQNRRTFTQKLLIYPKMT